MFTVLPKKILALASTGSALRDRLTDPNQHSGCRQCAASDLQETVMLQLQLTYVGSCMLKQGLVKFVPAVVVTASKA
jgi:aconitase B